MFVRIILVLIASFISLFVFWRRLKDDYVANQIFTTVSYIIIGISITLSVSKYFFPSFWFWFTLFGCIVGVLFGVYKFRMRITEVAEATILAILPGLLVMFSYELIASSMKLENAIWVLIIFVLIALFSYLDKHYKKFVWYKSGRVGFSGFSVLGIFFLARSLLAIKFTSMLSFTSGLEIYLSGVAAFLSFLIVFHLSREAK